jgi:chromate transporter
MIVLELFYLCFRTTLVSFGGVYGALPEFSRLFVVERGWITSHQLMESYMIGQIVPGPNMVMTVMIGYRVAGIPGAAAAFAGTYAPPVLLICGVAALFARFRSVAWVRRIELSLRPLVIGLLAGAAASIVRDQVTAQGVLPTLIVGAIAAIAYLRRWLGPLPLLLGSGVLFWLVSSGLALLGSTAPGAR